ncbi:MAG: hypothetical protein RBJ76_24960 [Stenomitos frigidus ULC029]
MTVNETVETSSRTIANQPLAVTVSAWDHNQVTPGAKHYLGVTITNRGGQDAVVQVRLEAASPLLRQWCAQPEQWLALSHANSGELTFCLQVPDDTVPQWLEYEVVVRPQNAYADYYLPPTRCRLQVLAPETAETTQDPTFTLSPNTTPDRPVIVQPGTLVPIELVVENRSERVDRFRLECTGLPVDWGIQLEYPRDYGGLGLVQGDDSLGVNPGDRGIIRALLQSPTLPLAGMYLPTFRLASENDPDLGLLALVYLRVEPIYRVQAQLEPVQDQVRDRPAQFALRFANLGNTSRQVSVNLQSLSPPGDCTYQLANETVIVAPQATTEVPLEARPQRWWTRPWFGTGKVYPFRVDFIDGDRQPITPETVQGTVTWMPRPWWQLLLVALAGLGLVGTLAFLIWWYFLRAPTPPSVLEFAAEDSRYTEVNGDMARVRWQIEHPERIQTLKLTGYSPEGDVLSGPLVYEFTNGQLPAALQPFCTQQKKLLNCTQIRSDAFQPGKYVFELSLIPQGRQAAPLVRKTAPVEIAAKPLPIVTALIPKALIYREAVAGALTPAEAALPVADAAGVRLDWAVTMPQDIRALRLVGRDKDGKMVGDLWYEFAKVGELPAALRPFCRIGATLICQNVPTGLKAVGEYRLELQALSADALSNARTPEPSEATAPKPKTTELIKIQPQIPQILSFQINGREAPSKLLIPVQARQTPPLVQISWRVQGGSTTRVELTPSPGTVPLTGKIGFPLSPQGGTTIVLQVKTLTGEVLSRSVTVEVYNPNPTDAAAIAEAAVKAAEKRPSATPASPAPSAPTAPATPASSAPSPGAASAPAVSDRLSPSEQAPQFNRGD